MFNIAGTRRVAGPAITAVLIIAILVGGGIYVRNLIQDAFIRSSYVRDAIDASHLVLRFQLDEETGMRGFAATGNRVFLEPYNKALAPFAAAIVLLDQHTNGPVLRPLKPRVADINAANERWRQAIVAPILARPHDDNEALQERGKQLVDRVRNNVAEIDALLTKRERLIAIDTQAAIDRFELFVGLAVAAVLIAAIVFARQQAILAATMEADRRRAAESRRAAEALAIAYETEKRVAGTLQQAFSQRPLPLHSSIRFSATYIPAAEEARVGGDWYDALELQNDRVFFAIGDVTGHGLDAAVSMSYVRQSLISSALFDPNPETVLRRVSEELYRDQQPLVTAVVGYADPHSFEFVYASAGHPPPLLIEPNKVPRFLDFGSVPLGAMPEAKYEARRVQSVPGSLLVLYTDGAIEHSRDVLEGEQLLIDAAQDARGSDETGYAAAIYALIFNRRTPGDDVAILTLAFAPSSPSAVIVSSERATDRI